MNKKGMSVFTILVVLMALTIGLAVNSQVGFDLDKFNSDLKWKDINITTSQPEMGNAITYYVNGLGSAYFEICKWVAKFSSENPNIPYKLLIWLLLISLFIPIIYYGTLIIVVIVLLIKEAYLNIKEKRLLNR